MIAAALLLFLDGVSGAPAFSEVEQAPRGDSVRPLVHVLLAYAFAWLAILAWTWRIVRLRKRGGP